MPKSGLKTVSDKMADLSKGLKSLTGLDVLVGVPAEEATRDNEYGDPQITNAALAYIHDRGAPEANIPARPFMTPGIVAVKDKINSRFEAAARAALRGDTGSVQNNLTAAGLTAQSSIRAVINAGPPPPLSPRTIANRKARGRISEKPLVDTGQLRNSINFIVRKK